MIEILLGVIALAALLMALALFQLGGLLNCLIHSLAAMRTELIEVMWAKMGGTQEQWRAQQTESHLNESERKHLEEFQRGQK